MAVSDWHMPGMDGLDLCRAIRKPVDASELVARIGTGSRYLDLVESLTSSRDELLSTLRLHHRFSVAIPNPIYIKNEQGEVLAANEALAQLVGRPYTKLPDSITTN